MGVTYRKLTSLFQQRLKEFGITPEQWSALYQVERGDGLMQKTIAERTGKDRPTTTRILDHLEAKELIYKRTGEHDRRSFFVYATEKGKELIALTVPVEQQMVRELTRCMTEEEYELLLALLSRIDRHIDSL